MEKGSCEYEVITNKDMIRLAFLRAPWPLTPDGKPFDYEILELAKKHYTFFMDILDTLEEK